MVAPPPRLEGTLPFILKREVERTIIRNIAGCEERNLFINHPAYPGLTCPASLTVTGFRIILIILEREETAELVLLGSPRLDAEQLQS